MKEVWFIRHGESEANAGFTTYTPSSISLTALGHKQAQQLIHDIEVQPDLFILTSYIRTQQTAKPVLEKFPEVPVEVWPLQEYDFLSPATCANTTIHERKPMVKDYWSKCDPDFVHGDGAESFTAFKHRVLKGLRDLENLEKKFIIVFAHGQVIRAIWQFLATGNEINMETFRDKMLPFEVPNAGIFKCRYEAMNWQIMEPSISLS